MNEIVIDKMQREIMTVPTAQLFADIERETKLYSKDECDFESIMLEHYVYMVRAKAEENIDYKQPLPYGAVIEAQTGKIFVYQRGGSSSNAGESRLHNKISFGVGGHIEREDEDSKNLMQDCLVREVEEEVNIGDKDIKKIEIQGYINDDSEEVGKVHMGLFYIIEVHHSNFDLLDGELDNGEFISIENLEKMNASDEYDLESWSEICLPWLKKYLQNR